MLENDSVVSGRDGRPLFVMLRDRSGDESRVVGGNVRNFAEVSKNRLRVVGLLYDSGYAALALQREQDC